MLYVKFKKIDFLHFQQRIPPNPNFCTYSFLSTW